MGLLTRKKALPEASSIDAAASSSASSTGTSSTITAGVDYFQSPPPTPSSTIDSFSSSSSSSTTTNQHSSAPTSSDGELRDLDVQCEMDTLSLANSPVEESSREGAAADVAAQSSTRMSIDMIDGRIHHHHHHHHHSSQSNVVNSATAAAQQYQHHQQHQHIETDGTASPDAQSHSAGSASAGTDHFLAISSIEDASSVAASSPTPYPAAVPSSTIISMDTTIVPVHSAAPTVVIPRKTSSRYNLADFTFMRTLGTGSFGRVHLVRSLHNSRSYAVKVLSKERVVKMKQVEHTNSEREMLEKVRHPFLVNLWGTFQCQRNLYMVMDFVAGGELFSLLRKSQRFPDPVAKFFAAEVALALDYLHSLDIIYRDLKPENILLGADGHVKITDFGFAKYVPDITWTLCGTPDYLAPEIIQSRGYNKSVDWYALGVLMFEMLAGYPPFFTEDPNPMRLYEKIILNKVRYPSYFSPTAISLLRSLLTSDLTKRFGNLARGSTDIFSHEWFQEVDWETLYRKEIPAPYVPKIEGEWDSSCFDTYSEIDVGEYGKEGNDEHRALFTSF